jgi:hypothetical protein
MVIGKSADTRNCIASLPALTGFEGRSAFTVVQTTEQDAMKRRRFMRPSLSILSAMALVAGSFGPAQTAELCERAAPLRAKQECPNPVHKLERGLRVRASETQVDRSATLGAAARVLSLTPAVSSTMASAPTCASFAIAGAVARPDLERCCKCQVTAQPGENTVEPKRDRRRHNPAPTSGIDWCRRTAQYGLLIGTSATVGGGEPVRVCVETWLLPSSPGWAVARDPTSLCDSWRDKRGAPCARRMEPAALIAGD